MAGIAFLTLLMFGGTVLGEGSSSLLAPLGRAQVWFMEAHNPVSAFFRTRSEWSRERTELYERIRELEEAHARARIYEGEYGFATSSEDRIVAQVTKVPNDTPYDTVVVNKGSADGVLEGVYAYRGSTAIGSVAKVYSHSSLITLFSTAGIESPVFIYGPNVYARGMGMGGGVIQVAVPQGITISVGDPVVVPFTHTDIYGTISYIESDPSDPDQYAFVSQDGALSSLRTVTLGRIREDAPTFAQMEEVVSALREARFGAAVADTLPAASTSAATSTNHQ